MNTHHVSQMLLLRAGVGGQKTISGFVSLCLLDFS